MDRSSPAYEKAFNHYLRTGTPVARTLKQARPTTHYIWRTRRDSRVRPSHAENDGKVFAWNNPPPTGHPGEDYGCRCIAEPYYGDIQETLSHILHDIQTTAPRWESHDMIWHYYTGDGKAVTLPEIGHLREVATHWSYRLRILDRWSRQIIGEARKSDEGQFTKSFSRDYGFSGVEYPHGDARVMGDFSGTVYENNGLLTISGKTDYHFVDRFSDPSNTREFVAWIRESPRHIRRLIETVANYFGLREGELSPSIKIDPDDVDKWFFLLTEIGGTAYDITGSWTSDLRAVILKDSRRSRY
ncbi:MAG: phage minor head protein [Parvibaculales bacterium]